jgi:predicted phosphodiesterase
MARILHIPDTHFPFQHKDYLKFLQFVYKDWGCDTVIHAGDIIDSHSHSRWPKSTKAKGAEDELNLVKKEIQKLAKIFPKMVITIGNHDGRVYSLARSVGIDSSYIKSLSEILELPEGWKFVPKYIKDNILFIHGTGSGRMATEKMVLTFGMNVCHGHLHSSAGISYIMCGDRQLFGMNSGSLIDSDTYAFEYGKDSAYKSIQGVGIIIDGQPYYERMMLNKNGRWRGF